MIPQGSANRLKEVGQWMAVNGESIYGCGASDLPQPKWGKLTAKARKLYLHVFNWPTNGQLNLEKLSWPAKRSYMLADPQKNPLPLKQDGEGVTITVPAQAPSSPDSVIALTP